MPILFLLFCIFLSGCASDPVNKTPVEGLMKYCNAYYVRGSWYYPQRHYEYDEIGIASWYGPGFHGKPKPSGEPFNQNALTAAHSTLPLPSVAKVTNLKNGKSVIVVVDDRGPFTYDGRIIDLSAQAAKVIGIYKEGLGTVRVQTLPEESRALCRSLVANGNKSGRTRCGRSWEQIYSMQATTSNYSGKHTEVAVPQLITASLVQVIPQKPSNKIDSLDYLINDIEKDKQVIKVLPIKSPQWHINMGQIFNDQKNAQQLLHKVRKKYPGKIKTIHHPSGKKFYNVMLGPFKDEIITTKATADLTKLGYKTIIIKAAA